MSTLSSMHAHTCLAQNLAPCGTCTEDDKLHGRELAAALALVGSSIGLCGLVHWTACYCLG